MGKAAYIDESKRRDYLLCAVVVVEQELHAVRKQLERAKGRHRGIHMASLDKKERMRMARVLRDVGVEAYLYRARGAKERELRDLVLKAAAPHLLDLGVTQVTIESCGQDSADRRVLQQVLGRDGGLTYGHAGKEELLLALPDIHAWSWGEGGVFRDLVKPITTDLGLLRP